LISDERIDDAVGRILYAKFSLGLFDKKDLLNEQTLSSPQTHRSLARDAVAQSLVLLKNEETILPLRTNNLKIQVVGSAADNVGRQMGAWSIEWQGIDGNWPDNSTSILAGIQDTVDKSTTVEYDATGNFSSNSPKADIGIAIVGEGPYAEGWGDTANPTLSEADKLAIKNLRRTSELVIVILVTGRPLIITDEIADWDAVVVAWLPGSEGGGISDVLFGKKEFTGTLPLPWPADTKQIPITAAGQTTDGSTVLFPRYFGLQY
jgi:beta-glucosidase